MLLPSGALRSTVLGELVAASSKATVVLACGSEATKLTVLVSGVGDPLNPGVVADGVVGRIDEDNLEVLVGGILVDPVGVEHTKVAGTASDPLLGDRAEVALELQLGDTVVGGLTVHDTLAVRPLAATTADAHAVHDVALLGLVSQTAGLVGPRRVGAPHNRGELATEKVSASAAKGGAVACETYRYSQQRTRKRKRITSDCFFFQSSSKYL